MTTKGIENVIKYCGLMQTALDQMPFPFWIKNKNSKMIFINRAYEKTFGVKKIDYVGRYDTDVWGEDIGRSYMEHDKIALDAKKPIYFQEKVLINNDSQLWNICKYPYIDNNGKYCIAGIAIGPIDRNN